VKYVRVQRLSSLGIAKAYHTIFHKTLSILTGITPININAQEYVTQYNVATGRYIQKYQIDKAENRRNWLHLADIVSVDTKDEGINEETIIIHIFTDGSKSVGAGVAIFKSGTHITSLQYKLNKRCSNNQAEQLAILRALEYTENLQTEDKTATIYTDS